MFVEEYQVILDFLKSATNERAALIPFYLLGKITEQLFGRLKATLLGWNSSYIGFGSRLRGTKAIEVGSGAYINRYAWIDAVHSFGNQTFMPKITIGRNFSSADRLHISAVNFISIGDNCLFGSGVYISDHNHGAYKGELQSPPYEPPIKRRLASYGAINIGSNVWLGDNVIVVGSISIGAGSVVGANSVITKNVPPNVMVAGTPFRILKTFNEKSLCWE